MKNTEPRWKFFIRVYKNKNFWALDKYFIYMPHFAIGFAFIDYDTPTFLYVED